MLFLHSLSAEYRVTLTNTFYKCWVHFVSNTCSPEEVCNMKFFNCSMVFVSNELSRVQAVLMLENYRNKPRQSFQNYSLQSLYVYKISGKQHYLLLNKYSHAMQIMNWNCRYKERAVWLLFLFVSSSRKTTVSSILPL